MMRSGVLEVDGISALPEPILHHILSFLPFKEVAQTCLLSKRWKQVWQTFPDVEVGGVFTNPRKSKEILTSLERALLNRQDKMISIKKFSLELDLINSPENASLAGQCLGLAIESEVKELVLVHWRSERRNLPEIIFYVESLHVLELSYCKLQQPSKNVKLFSLRKLALREVCADDQAIASLISGCPLIEYLEIRSCEGLESLDLVNLSNLKEIILVNTSDIKRVEIKTSNVNALAIHQTYLFPIEVNVSSCGNLKCLKFDFLPIEDEWLCNVISKLPLLEYLSMTKCHKLTSVRISSPCLKTLILECCDKLIQVEIETPNLSIFKYHGDLISFSSNALSLSETSLCFSSHLMVNIEWVVEYFEILAMFQKFSKVLNLQCREGENVIVPQELRQIQSPPLTSVKKLNYSVRTDSWDFSVANVRARSSRFSIANVLDGLLWTSPHAEMVSIEHGHLHKFSFQISYKKQLIYDGEIPRCCQSLPVSCWQHCINEVEVEHTKSLSITEDGELQHDVRSYYCFEGGEDIFEKIDDLSEAV